MSDLRKKTESEKLAQTAGKLTSNDTPSHRMTRRDKRKFASMEEGIALDANSAALEKEHEELTKVKNIHTVQVKYVPNTFCSAQPNDI